jgi:hypothetical protein
MKQLSNQRVDRGIIHLFFVPTLFVIMAAFIAITASFVFGQTFNPPHTIGLGGTADSATFVAGAMRLAFDKKFFTKIKIM